MTAYRQLDEIQQDLVNKKVSCVQLVQHYLSKIKEKAHLNAFIEVYSVEALKQAESIDQKIKENKAGQLAGLIFGIKDLLCFEGHTVSGASKILEGFQSPITATAIQQLLAEDAVLIGRQNCDEFGMGSSNENSCYGPVLNDADTEYVPGGSSGGSAVAVQAGLCLASIGTDTGGSVRQPASFCGIVGMKPTYSRISRWGLLAYASSFDTIGVLTHDIKDAQKIINIMSGQDPKDATSAQAPAIKTEQEQPEKYRVAYLANALSGDGVSKSIQSRFKQLIDTLGAQNHQVDGIQFDYEEYLLPTYYILTTAEASTNLSRYDGVHYGKRSAEASDMESLYKNSRTEGFGPEVRRRIMLGTYVLSADYHDAYFKKAQQLRRLIKEETEQLLATYDVILSPTSPTTAFRLGEHQKNPLEMYMADVFTVQASVAGIPAISIPLGRDKKEMPFGLQIMADAFREDKIFAFSNYLRTLIDQEIA